MRTSIQIGSFEGIPIKLHVTFLLILPVFAYMFAVNDPMFGFNDVPVLLRAVLSMMTAILLFFCVLLHEIGHSYVAKKHGTNIQNITLFLFGGVSSMEEMPRNPKIELKMAIAGPAVSILIGSSLLIIHGFFTIAGQETPFLRLVWLIGYINLTLFVFNMLPAFPMDGGRVLRAWLAGRMSYIEATRSAAGVGKMFAIFMGIFGFLSAWMGGAGLWLTLIALFIYIGASEEEKSTEYSVVLEGVKIKDIMSKDVITVPSGMTVEQLVDHMFKFKHMGYPVVDNGSLEGIVTFTDVQKVPKEHRHEVLVSRIMTKELITSNDEDEAIIALKQMKLKNIGRIIIIKDGMIKGIVSRTDILRAVQLLG